MKEVKFNSFGEHSSVTEITPLTVEKAIEFIESKIGKKLSFYQTLLVQELWNNPRKTYPEIHKTKASYLKDPKYLDKEGSNLWKLLNDKFKTDDIGKFTFQVFIEKQWNLENTRLENHDFDLSRSIILPERDTDSQPFQQERTYTRFIKRTSESDKILNHLKDESSNPIISLVGLGGIGKTALCHHIATQAYQNKLIQKVIWIRAKKQQFDPFSSEEIMKPCEYTLSFEQSLKEIGYQIPGITKDVLDDILRLKEFIKEYFTNSPSLVVIDGLEDSENPQIIANELREILGNSKLILTSRKEVGSYTFKCDVNKMNREDSHEFLLTIARDVNCEAILQAGKAQKEKIVKITDGMPLAMKLVVSNANHLTIDRIIDRLSSVPDEATLYNYIYEDAWQELTQRKATDAQDLLIFLADDPEPIVRNLLYGFVRTDITEGNTTDGNKLSNTQVDDALKILKNLSLVEFSEQLVSLHSLTVQYINETLRKRYE